MNKFKIIFTVIALATGPFCRHVAAGNEKTSEVSIYKQARNLITSKNLLQISSQEDSNLFTKEVAVLGIKLAQTLEPCPELAQEAKEISLAYSKCSVEMTAALLKSRRSDIPLHKVLGVCRLGHALDCLAFTIRLVEYEAVPVLNDLFTEIK